MGDDGRAQKFGGKWTEQKLDMFTGYLNAYLTALQNQKFKKIYIDAFAGTGKIETRDGSQTLIGSARRALAADLKFDLYFFVEKESEKADKLRAMVAQEFPALQNRVTVYPGDANEKLDVIIRKFDWRYYRGLLFLDPFATSVNWETLEKIARTESIDVWYLFHYMHWNVCFQEMGKSGLLGRRILIGFWEVMNGKLSSIRRIHKCQFLTLWMVGTTND